MQRVTVSVSQPRGANFRNSYGTEEVWPALGDNPTPAAKQFQKQMIAAAAKVTAVQMGLSIALMCIPVFGWALAALMAIATLIAGDRVKKKIKEITNGISRELDAYQRAAQAEVHAAESRLADELWPDATKLAVSSAALDGWISDVWEKTKKITKKVVKPIVKVHNMPVKFIGKHVIKGIQHAAETVNDTKLANKLKGKEDSWENQIDRTTNQAAAAIADPEQMAKDMERAAGVVTGDEQIRKAKEGAEKIKAEARVSIDTAKREALTGMQAPEYRATMTRNLARAIRDDPKLMVEARYYQEQEQKLAVQNGLPSNAVVPTIQSGGGGLAVAAAAVGAYFMMR